MVRSTGSFIPLGFLHKRVVKTSGLGLVVSTILCIIFCVFVYPFSLLGRAVLAALRPEPDAAGGFDIDNELTCEECSKLKALGMAIGMECGMCHKYILADATLAT